jgi:DnaJ-class molecular chaperone
MAQHTCPRCDGFGDDGIEEESGHPYTCFYCGGTGLVDESEPDVYDPTPDDFADADAIAYGEG